MDALLDDVTTAVSELDLGRPVVVGHSWGATIALELVGTRPKLASGLVFIDGPVQSAANLFSWDDAQRIMQPPLPRYGSFAEAVADSRRDFEGAWGDDLEPFVTARIVRDRDGLILTLTAPARLELLRGLYESQPDMLWSQVTVPAVALLALQSFSRFSKSKEDGAARLAVIAPAVEVRWLDSPHDIPLFMPADVASEIERICILASADLASEAPAG
jgi:pimeloyl-ACP methyl ester carboxylesterase